MTYSVAYPTASIKKKFEKELLCLPKKLQEDVISAVCTLGANPRPHGEPKIKPPLEVYDYVAQYRIRIGDYRVLYDVDDQRKTVWILTLRRRNERTYR